MKKCRTHVNGSLRWAVISSFPRPQPDIGFVQELDWVQLPWIPASPVWHWAPWGATSHACHRHPSPSRTGTVPSAAREGAASPSRPPESLSPFLPERCCLRCNHTITVPLKCHIWRNPYKQSINHRLEIVVFTTNDLLSLHTAPSRHLHWAASFPRLASEVDQRYCPLCCSLNTPFP